MLFAGEGRSWCDKNDLFDPDYITDEILADLRRSERFADAPTGTTAVYLTPQAVSGFLWAVNMGVNGRNVAKGTSPLRDRLGEQVFDPHLTLIDDPHVDYCPAAAEIDGDGVPTRRSTIVEKGVLKMFLYDLDSAGLAGAEPTGHRGCSPYSAEILPGDKPSESLLASVHDGLYVKGVMGLGQSNIINGDFACNVSLGYRIRDGEFVGRVKNIMIAGNLYDILARDVGISSDRDPVSRLPHLVVTGVTVSTAREG